MLAPRSIGWWEEEAAHTFESEVVPAVGLLSFGAWAVPTHCPGPPWAGNASVGPFRIHRQYIVSQGHSRSREKSLLAGPPVFPLNVWGTPHRCTGTLCSRGGSCPLV